MEITENGELVFGALDEDGNHRIRLGDNITAEGFFIFNMFVPPITGDFDAIPLGFFNGGII